MNKQQQLERLIVQAKKQLKGLKAVDTSKVVNLDGLSWWTRKGFKVTEDNLKYTATNGKVYPAVRGTTKDGKSLLLIATRNGAIYTAKQF